MASIHLELDEAMELALNEGPLASTGGRGKSAYVRKLIERDLANYLGEGKDIREAMKSQRGNHA